MIQGMTAKPSTTGEAPLHPADAAYVAQAEGVVRVFRNPSRWWQNASFALPLLVAVVSLAIGLVTGRTEALGFGLFAAVVTLIMVPVVLLTWRGTSTAIVLSQSGVAALHVGRPIHEFAWADLKRIERVEYLGNTRYKLVHGEDDRFLSVESEIEDGAGLVELAFELSGVPRQTSAPIR